MKYKVLALIPARAGSKRIPNKNIKKFLGKPLIAYTIEQARSIKFIDRTIVDTDSKKIAKIAHEHKAEIPFLRPPRLAGDTAKITDVIIHLLQRLRAEEKYIPTHVMILQTTSPLRQSEDIEACWNLMKSTDATTTTTVCPTLPLLHNITKNKNITLANRTKGESSNTQSWPPGFMLNGNVFIIKTENLLKEKTILTKNTKATICSKWSSIDIDVPEEWIVAEIVYKYKGYIKRRVREASLKLK